MDKQACAVNRQAWIERIECSKQANQTVTRSVRPEASQFHHFTSGDASTKEVHSEGSKQAFMSYENHHP